MSETEMDPGGNWFALGIPAPKVCPPATNYIAGMGVLNVGIITEGVMFTSPRPTGSGGPPAIEVFGAGYAVPAVFPLTGTDMHAGGVMCMPGLGQSFAVTDSAMSAVSGGVLGEHPLPGASTPVSCAGIGGCLGLSNSFTFVVETTLPSIEVVLGATATSFPIPAPTVAYPDSFTSGIVSGVLVYTATTVYKISGGTMTPTPLGGTYLFHTTGGGGVTVTTTAAPVFIPAAGSIVPFADCSVPLDSCGLDTTASAIAMNISPCPLMDAGTADWPAPLATCMSTGGLTRFGPAKSKNSAKYASVFAWAKTTLGAMDRDPAGAGRKKVKILNQGNPGTSAGTATALAFSGGGGDWCWASISISAAYDPIKNAVVITKDRDKDRVLVHQDGHTCRYNTGGSGDPFEFIGWDDTRDLEIDYTLAQGTYLPMPTSVQPGSITEMTFSASCTLPGFGLLYRGSTTATLSGFTPTLNAQFSSDPALGLDDAAVETAIEAAFSYDSAKGAFVVGSDSTVVSLTIDVPTGISTFSVANDSTDVGELLGTGYMGSPPVLRACCLSDGFCIEVTTQTCSDIGGVLCLSPTCLGDGDLDGRDDACLALIPTVSEWGLAIMTLLVLAAGTVVLVRRRSVERPV